MAGKHILEFEKGLALAYKFRCTTPKDINAPALKASGDFFGCCASTHVSIQRVSPQMTESVFSQTGDVVMTSSRAVGVVEHAAQNMADKSIWLVIERYTAQSTVDFSPAGSSTCAVSSSDILGALMYRRVGPDIRVILPKQAATWAPTA